MAGDRAGGRRRLLHPAGCGHTRAWIVRIRRALAIACAAAAVGVILTVATGSYTALVQDIH
jgi:hypothetical protein